MLKIEKGALRMQIGEVIRKYRKAGNLTQEEMANRLGVTAPAVNKWENGNSLPDITLLAPIARLLGISLDILLSYTEDLTAEEIREIVNEANVRLKEESYESAFSWANEKIRQFPACLQLIWQLAVLFDAWRLAKVVPDREKYEEPIRELYARVLESKDEDIRNSAADSLFGFYLRKGQYEKAEEYLAYFSKQNPERKRKQALIYSENDRISEAYKAYEELLFSGYQMSSMVFYSLFMLALKENDMEKAHFLVEKHSALARTFEMGQYQEASCRLELATMEKDKEAVVEIMKQMLDGVDDITAFGKTRLYEHMTFKEVSKDFQEELRDNLLKAFRDEDSYGFLKDDQRWQELVK